MEKEPFILENYITISAHSPEYKAQLEKVYADIAKTPEGQEMIKKAYELNDHKRLSVEGPAGGKTHAEPDTGKVILPENDIARKTYYGNDNAIHDTSLNRAAFHETFHMADEEHKKLLEDPEAMARVQEGLMQGAFLHAASVEAGRPVYSPMDKAYGDVMEKFEQGDREVMSNMYDHIINNMPHEKRAVEATNTFMEKHYDEPPRQLKAATQAEGSSELEIRTMKEDAPSPLNM